MDYAACSDKTLVERAVRGDRAAFGAVFERYWPLLLRFARRLVGDAGEDVVQEALLRAYLTLPVLRKPRSLRAWLYGITLNTCREHQRAEHNRMRRLAEVYGGMYEPGWPAAAPDEAFERKAHAQLIRRAVENLPGKHRQAVLLHYFEHLSVNEIAEILGVSRSVVKTRLHRARRSLRPLFQEAAEPRKEKAGMASAEVLDVIGEEQVLLFSREKQMVLPIFMSREQASAIALAVEGVSLPRPLTFQLVAQLLAAARVKVEEVTVTELKNGTFFAGIRLSNGVTVDARPSDAINLALIVNAPLSVDDSVFASAGIPVEIEDGRDARFERKGTKSLAQEFLRKAGCSFSKESVAEYVRSLRVG